MFFVRKLIFVLAAASAVLTSGCTKKTKEYVFLGQLYYTWGHATQEKMKGRVKEIKQTHFFAEEENGKIVKGKVITIEERPSLAGMGRDMAEEYNESGTVLRSTFFDENGKVLQDVKANAEGKNLLGAEYYINDTLRAITKFKYDGNNLLETIAYNPINDTVFMSIKYDYDQNGYTIKNQSFNYKGEPQGYTIRKRNESGQLVQNQSYSNDGKLNSQVDYTYNDKGERITQHQQNFTTGVIIDYTFTYNYDKMGNYTAIIFHKDGKPFIYRARELKYYD